MPDPQPMSSDLPPDLPTVRFSQRRLENGMRVIVAPDSLAPVVAINIWYVVGSRHEQPGRTGFAHLFEHFMFQGSRHVAKAEHFSIVQSAGGVNNATTYFDRTNYFETMPSHQYEIGLWLEADRMATLLDALDQENLDNQREVVKNEKRQSYDNRPYGSFYERLMAAVFPADHPYHHTPIGSMEDLNAASVEDVVNFFSAWYAPNNAVLSIVGDVDEEAAHAAAERFFGPIRANWSIEQPPLPAIEPTIGHEMREVVPDAVPLTRVHFGFRCPAYGTKEFDALEVCSQILAGGRGSRLYRNLVREKKIAQDVTAFGLPLVAGASFFGGWVTVRPDSDEETCEEAFLEQLDRLTEELVTDDELARARALIEASELGALSRVEEVADRLSMFAALFDRPELVNEQLPRYLAITAEDIRDAARQVFRADNRVVLTYVPRPGEADSANEDEEAA
ncbi:MAG TPA: pitrilysin family protein [Candidatus Limnocylindrales bacterium]|nr:pitrilysin family protein [Candidatus Limnocylindrales bacterium]